MTYDYLLLGGGTSCAYAAVAIREHDKERTVAVTETRTKAQIDDSRRNSPLSYNRA